MLRSCRITGSGEGKMRVAGVSVILRHLGQSAENFKGYRSAEKITLHSMTTHSRQKLLLLVGLNPFGDHIQAKLS